MKQDSLTLFEFSKKAIIVVAINPEGMNLEVLKLLRKQFSVKKIMNQSLFLSFKRGIGSRSDVSEREPPTFLYFFTHGNKNEPSRL